MRRAILTTAALAAILVPTALPAQDGANDAGRPGGPGASAPEPRSEPGAASGGATGFDLAGGTFADLPDAAPPPRDSPLDPEDRPENVDADDMAGQAPDGEAAVIVPTPNPNPNPNPNPSPPADAAAPPDETPDEAPDEAPDETSDETSDERRAGDAPVTVVPGDMPGDMPGEMAGDMPDPDALPPVRERLAESDEEFAACTARLAELGTAFEAASPLVEAGDPDCGIMRPVRVSEIVPGVALRPDALMRCATARALAEWTREGVLPAAEALGASVTAIDHGSTYVCRRRNNRPAGKPSEHSFGNAVDVMGFRFAAREAVRIEPREPGGPVAVFQRAVREASCEHFTTVLGPGADASHADHLHLDVKQRRGDYRMCQ